MKRFLNENLEAFDRPCLVAIHVYGPESGALTVVGLKDAYKLLRASMKDDEDPGRNRFLKELAVNVAARINTRDFVLDTCQYAAACVTDDGIELSDEAGCKRFVDYVDLAQLLCSYGPDERKLATEIALRYLGQGMRLKVTERFSRTPGARYRSDGDWSAEQFRDDVLVPSLREAMSKGCELLVDLDGAAGYAASFLEEAFGGIMRVHGLPLEIVNESLRLVSVEEPELVGEIKEFMQDAEEARRLSQWEKEP